MVIRTTAKTDLVKAIAYLTWPALVAPLVGRTGASACRGAIIGSIWNWMSLI